VDLSVSPAHVAGGVIAAFCALALVFEAPLLAWSERVPVRWFSAGSLAAIALVCLGASLTTGPIGLLVALALYGPAAGCALAAAEGVLVEAQPEARERAMARLTLAAAIGDLSVPALLFALTFFGLGWRWAFALAALVASALAVVHAGSRELDRLPVTSDEDDDGPTPSLRETVRTALEAPGLVAWSVAGAMTSMLDELLVAFAAVHLSAHVDAGPELRSLAIGVWMIGGLGGLGLLDRLLGRVEPVRLLLGAAVLAAAALLVLALTDDAYVAIGALFVIGASGATFHPITKARAYAALPGRPAIVNAMASSLSLLDLGTALGIAAVADILGSSGAVVALIVSPVVVGLVAARELHRSRAR
jgi:DHA1 family chloramphenicol resistance protein-like MFS transporter